jgi:hypothetical protein
MRPRQILAFIPHVREVVKEHSLGTFPRIPPQSYNPSNQAQDCPSQRSLRTELTAPTTEGKE